MFVVAPWQGATVVDVRPETGRVKTFRLALDDPVPRLAGQHFLVRLTAEGGYRAQRSYSVGTPPDGDEIELTVERLPGGEVSNFLHDELSVGDRLEVRGPVGGWFVWAGTSPALLIGGGSGVVPLMSMLRLARRIPHQSLVHLVVSVRSPQDLIYSAEMAGPDVDVLYTRSAPPSTARPAGRIAADDLAPVLRGDETVFVCGSNGFVEAATALLLEGGIDTGSIRVERFGPTAR
jgi:ferredoxin-NADP reductase